MINPRLKDLFRQRHPDCWTLLEEESLRAEAIDDLLALANLRRQLLKAEVPRPGGSKRPLRLALTGSYSFQPLAVLLELLLESSGWAPTLFLGEYDNAVSELTSEGELREFQPEVTVMFPSAERCRYEGSLTDLEATIRAEAERQAGFLLGLARAQHEACKSEVVLVNHLLPASADPGAYRVKSLATDWSFRKLVNQELGLRAPAYVHVCDLEFLAYRHGGLQAWDPKRWFESKQPCSPDHLVHLARELVQITGWLHAAPKKVLVLDLDNTLWGGVIGDDGVEGIEIGGISPLGEAYKAFQEAVAAIRRRGVLLAVCSKNDDANAREPFARHSGMVLKLEDFVAFKANWEPKPDNLRAIAQELNVGVDSLVFADDNPAEIEIVRQFLPEVGLIRLGPDVSTYVRQLHDSRFFEPKQITEEDAERTRSYHAESQRRELQSSVSDLDSYLESLRMEATLREITAAELPRVAQLVARSNQFNLTTRRRSEGELAAIVPRPDWRCFTLSLRDRFGDYGLVSLVMLRQDGDVAEIDTWIMSCRVLKRNVEDEVMNECARLAGQLGCGLLRGLYLPTAKNGMVREHYPRMGFLPAGAVGEGSRFELPLANFSIKPSKIHLLRRSYE